MTDPVAFRWRRFQPQPEISSPAGWAPMDASQTWTAGYIANRNAIGRAGSSKSDAEVVTEMSGRRGMGFLHELAGPLSLVRWDSREQQLVVAADRVGVFPLFYSVRPEGTWISDRATTLLSSPRSLRGLNVKSCVRFLHGKPPVAGQTFTEAVHSVLPGRTLTFSATGAVAADVFWELEPQPVLRLNNARDYEAALLEVLQEVIPGHLPVGRFGVTLSGGLDSTSVAAIARTTRPNDDIVAFSWVAPELPAADEESVARVAAAHLGIPLIPIRADLHWPLSGERGLVTTPESPFVNFYSELWDETFQVMADEGVDAAVSGLDGDRLFGGGLFPYADLLLTGHWWALSKQIRHHLRCVTQSLLSLLRQTIAYPVAHAYFPPIRSRAEPVSWLRAEFWELLSEEPGPVWRGLPGRYLRNRMLVDPFVGQAASLGTARAAEHGIELRHPLLDHRLIEFAARLPQTMVTEGFTQKAIVRRAMSTLLPEEVTEQFDKTRPTAIGYRGLREREQEKVWPLMRDMRLSDLGLVDERVLQDEYQEFLDGRGSTMFWYTITLEDWLRRYW